MQSVDKIRELGAFPYKRYGRSRVAMDAEMDRQQSLAGPGRKYSDTLRLMPWRLLFRGGTPRMCCQSIRPLVTVSL